MTDFQQYVQSHVGKLSGPQAEDAWNSLVEAGPIALPHLVSAYDSIQDPRVRLSLISVVCQYRVAEALPFLGRLVETNEPDVWKGALDGLVSLGGEPALTILRTAEATATGEKRDWIEEAVQQIIDVGTA